MMPQDGGGSQTPGGKPPPLSLSAASPSSSTAASLVGAGYQAAATRSKRVSAPIPGADHVTPHQLFHNNSFRSELDAESALPGAVRARLSDLFYQIEKEFESVYSENLSLQEKIDALNERLDRENVATDKQGVDATDFDAASSKGFSKHKLTGSSQKLKTAHKLKAQTSKIVSSFKAPTVSCQLVREFQGHRDGIWEVAVSRTAQPVIGTAATDHTACIWSVETGRCLLRYLGHTGSVNSLRFHPSRDLAVTASGDQRAHVWQAQVNLELQKASSSDEEGPYADDGAGEGVDFMEKVPSLRTPVVELRGHSSVVIAADWLAPAGDHLVTASWDRTACLWDAETGDMLHALAGHDQELTHTSAHHSQRLVVTSSRDTTFRLWDFREPIHSVSVFQGHTETVTSAVFTKREDKVVSGSDDRTVKVWDLRNMRSPLATIRGDSGVNKLAVSSQSGVVAIPYDNRQVRLFDINCPGGQRVARLPRTSRQGHQRMVSSVAWADDSAAVPGMTCNFFSCGFDRLILGWSIQSIKDSKEV